MSKRRVLNHSMKRLPRVTLAAIILILSLAQVGDAKPRCRGHHGHHRCLRSARKIQTLTRVVEAQHQVIVNQKAIIAIQNEQKDLYRLETERLQLQMTYMRELLKMLLVPGRPSRPPKHEPKPEFKPLPHIALMALTVRIEP